MAKMVQDMFDARQPHAETGEAVGGATFEQLRGVLMEFKKNADDREEVLALLAQLETSLGDAASNDDGLKGINATLKLAAIALIRVRGCSLQGRAVCLR